MNPLVGLALLAAAALVAIARGKGKEPQPVSKPKRTVRAFMSFDYDHDLALKNLFAGQCSSDSPTPFTVHDWSSKAPLPQKQWEQLIAEKIGRCHIVFVLVSPTAHRASGVAKEIKMAAKANVPIVGIYVAGAGDSTALPKGLARDRTIGWNWKRIAQEVDRVAEVVPNRF